ncbi:MAG: DUF427 domain-containing protein [Planctomycetota bacterium]
MIRAICRGVVIAESDATVVVEGNHYFPLDAVRRERLRDSATTSFCGWKGTASYYDVVVDEHVSKDAAWYYADPKSEAAEIRGRVAFWKDVTVG